MPMLPPSIDWIYVEGSVVPCFWGPDPIWRAASGAPIKCSALPSLFTSLRALCRFLASPPPHRRGGLGYRGVRACPSGAFSAEIRSDDVRLGLGTFETAHKVARTYDAAAWHLRRSGWDMNFPEVPTLEMAEELAPPPRLITNEDRRETRRRQRHLSLAEMDEEAMEQWRKRFLQDVINEQQFFAQRRTEREEKRAERAAYREDKRRGRRPLSSTSS
ncbi:uncharacterized protein [Aegilops tauschii subsp. strangulata]|uniref:uncharacterized protein n=1 Tax=Aegilops tauschii subsp. strangulata TaxID=200361 RepID=UPI00098A548F|nr:ethylene-responsive transcription factor 1-like [Aegilops tauschii subsp. strangulata]